MEGQRFDQWTQKLARRLSPEGSAERALRAPLGGGQVPPAAATPAVADGTCAYGDLPTTTTLRPDEGEAQTSSQGICGWQDPPLAPTDTAPSLPARTGRPARRQRARPISAREQEVSALIGQGLKDREIAAALVLSEHTVHAHVRNVLDKLGLASRAQIAAWVVAQARADQSSTPRAQAEP